MHTVYFVFVSLRILSCCRCWTKPSVDNSLSVVTQPSYARFFLGGGGQPGHRNNVAAAAIFWAPQFNFIPFPLLPREGGEEGREEGAQRVTQTPFVRSCTYAWFYLFPPSLLTRDNCAIKRSSSSKNFGESGYTKKCIAFFIISSLESIFFHSDSSK